MSTLENWPERHRSDWREVTQNRNVPREWVGREPLMHWEAKVYTYWK
jgi:pullulanase